MGKSRGYSEGFTLIEMLVVIAIIGILAGMLFSALSTARKYVRKVKAGVEVKNLEGAWKQYYAEYYTWPTNNSLVGSDPETDKVAIKGYVASLLQGINTGTGNSNRKKLQFMQFSKFDSNGDPINPWGDSSTFGSNYYYVKFDVNYDNTINAGGGSPGDPPDISVSRPVVVWTVNGNEPDKVIGSWQ